MEVYRLRLILDVFTASFLSTFNTGEQCSVSTHSDEPQKSKQKGSAVLLNSELKSEHLIKLLIHTHTLIDYLFTY